LTRSFLLVASRLSNDDAGLGSCTMCCIKNILTFLALTALLVVGAAHAAKPKSIIPDLEDGSRKGDVARLEQQKKKDSFTLADEDKSGVLSRDEVSKHFPFYDQNFERYDLNKDGDLSWIEFGGRGSYP
jgi:hypothetical protein